MLSLYSTLSFRYLRRRWFRALLIVASIALGVATLVATRALNATMTKAGLASLNPLTGGADLIVSNGETSVRRDLDHDLARIPGVAVVLPRIFETVQVTTLKDSPVLLIGIDKEAEKQATDDSGDEALITITYDLNVRDAQAMKRAFGDAKAWQRALQGITREDLWALVRSGFEFTPAVIGKDFLARLPGEPRLLRVLAPGRRQPALVLRVGTVEGHGGMAALSGNVIVTELSYAAGLAGLKKGQVSRIDLRLEPGADRDAVKEKVRRRLAGRAEVFTTEENNQVVANAMAGLQTGFSLCGLAALVVGLFLVYNALSVTVAERRHEIGILLSVGATRAQVRALFGGEAALLGLAGALLGIPLGIGLAYLLQPLVQAVLRDIFMTVEAQDIDISPALLAVAVVAGILTAMAAALIPAMMAAREKPAEAVRRVPHVHTWRYRVTQAAASALMMAVGLLLIVARDYLPLRVGMYGGLVAVLLGTLLATPLLADLAAQLVRPVVRQLFGIEARLAADNLVRAPQRTGLVIAALAAGVALVMQTAGTVRSNRVALHTWVDDAFAADLFADAGSALGAGGVGRSMEIGLGRQLETLPNVTRAIPFRTRRLPYRDGQILVLGLPAGAYWQANQGRAVSNLDLFKALADEPDAVLVSENFAALYHVRVGDTITLPGPARLKVVGKLVDYSWNRGTVFVNRPDFVRHWQDDKVDTFEIYLNDAARDDPEAISAAKAAVVDHYGAAYGLVVKTRAELRQHIDSVIEQMYLIAYALQVMVMLVAALGVVMAFLISVLQRRREMGLLRAIGASQAQVVRSVLAEAALVGVIGTAIGLLVGVPLEWFVLRVAFLEESGFLFAVHIPWLESLVIAAAALLLATLAGLGPALHAVRQRIPEAIAYE